jgi:hypothetical protein
MKAFSFFEPFRVYLASKFPRSGEEIQKNLLAAKLMGQPKYKFFY